ncbi:hypothetical protein QN363_09340, partial [Undibacterium sp. CCC2.1]
VLRCNVARCFALSLVNRAFSSSGLEAGVIDVYQVKIVSVVGQESVGLRSNRLKNCLSDPYLF